MSNQTPGAQHPAPVTTSPRIHLAFLDGMRALAALWVVLNHCWIHVFSGGVYVRSGWKGAATNWMLYGHLAVDVFIVLSGFCLMLPVARSGSIAGGVWGFYSRRAVRILPTYYAAFALCLVLNFVIHWHNASSWLYAPISKRAIVANIFLMQDLFRSYANQINGPTWSVATEWKIYFLFPAFVWMIQRIGTAFTLIVSAMIGYGLMEYLHLTHLGLPPDSTCAWYVFLFAAGVVAGATVFGQAKSHVAGRNGVRLWAGVSLLSALLLGVSLVFFPSTNDLLYGTVGHLPIIDAAMGAFTASSLIWLSMNAELNKKLFLLKVFSWRPLVALGTFSYSIYLMHYPLIFLWLHVFSSRHLLSSDQKSIVFGLVGIPSIIAAAYLFFLVFERPFLNTRRKETFAETARDAALSPAP